LGAGNRQCGRQPSFGFVRTEDHGTIEILLHLSKA